MWYIAYNTGAVYFFDLVYMIMIELVYCCLHGEVEQSVIFFSECTRIYRVVDIVTASKMQILITITYNL